MNTVNLNYVRFGKFTNPIIYVPITGNEGRPVTKADLEQIERLHPGQRVLISTTKHQSNTYEYPKKVNRVFKGPGRTRW